jgi:hypothetical protein
MRVSFEDVRPRALVLGPSQVVDHIHTTQRGAQATFVAQTRHSHFDRDSARQVWRARRRADESAHILSIGHQLTDQRPSDKTGSTGYKDHERDYIVMQKGLKR